ncbi:hypothetical protein ISS07_02930 [Candidatus Woesearchaeota archaeon]|nr:hypothetical protein [Candidatus Woesearchaeota archaeon]
MQKEDDLFFVEVKEPNEIRRGILESLKDIVENLQRFEKFKEIRKEKMHNIEILRTDLKDLNKQITNLKSAFPDTKLREIKTKLKPTIDKKKTKKRKHKPKEVIQEKPKTELDRLESELGAIEEKLKGLQ